jgi:hypothetical protein
MANRTKVNPAVENPSQSSTIKNIIFIFPIIAIIAFIWLLMLYLDQLPESLTFNQDFNTWLNLWLVILILIIVILVCIPQSGESPSAQEVVVQPKTKRTTKSQPSTAGMVTTTMVPIEDEEKPLEFVPLTKEEHKSETGKVTIPSTVADSTKAKPSTDRISIDQGKPEPKPSESLAPSIKKDKGRPRIIEYPLEVDGGLYGDTFIELDNDTVLKLRTMVVKDVYLM